MFERCEIHRLGVIPYEEAWRLQETFAAQIGRGERLPSLLLLQHPHTYTFGRRGRVENLLWDEAELIRRGVKVHWVDRGGDVTYHGPGQLVGYPLLPLAPGGLVTELLGGVARLPQADFIGYLRKLEQVLVETLRKLGVESCQVEGLTGVWVQDQTAGRLAKIAAIGVKVDAKGISRHGFALNVDPDMAYWEGIIGCGLKEHPVTSLTGLLDPVPDMDKVVDVVMEAFREIFACNFV